MSNESRFQPQMGTASPGFDTCPQQPAELSFNEFTSSSSRGRSPSISLAGKRGQCHSNSGLFFLVVATGGQCCSVPGGGTGLL